MPFIIVKMLEGRPPEKIEKLIEEMTATAVRVLDAPIETVRIIIEEVPKTHWGIAGQSAKAKGR